MQHQLEQLKCQRAIEAERMRTGQIDAQIARVKTLSIQGKTVVVPGEEDAAEPSAGSQKEQRRADRKRKKSQE